jgi:HSP20 family protein
MNQLLQDSVVWPGSPMGGSGRTAMPLDVVENPDNFVVYASMPGVKPDDVQITIQGDTLTIRGQTSSNLNEPQGQQGQQAQSQQAQSQQSQGRQSQGQQGQSQGQSQGRQDIVQSQSNQNQNYLLRERKQASYFRQVTLPTMVTADKATAQFEHGELIITLPKAEEAKPKQIRIGSQGQPQRTIEASSQPSSHQGSQMHSTQSSQGGQTTRSEHGSQARSDQ